MDIFIYFMVGIFGLIIGSFLNCLIWRLYKSETLGGRSYCPKCRQQIAWYDNIPLLSYLLLKGRCRRCRKSISWQYPLVELGAAILFILIFYLDSSLPLFPWLLARDWLFISGLIVIFVYDWRWQLIPMNIVWPLGVVMIIFNLLLGISWWQLILTGAVGAGFFVLQYLITKKKGIGEGDIWLGALLGVAFPDFWQLLLILIISYGLGSVISLSLMAANQKGWKSRIALGPFLVIGAIITLIWGDYLITWYLGLF